jgi:hypothetical protein
VNDTRVAWDGLFVQSVDPPSPDAARRGSVRSGQELVSRSAGRAVAVPATPIIVPETRGIDSYKDVTRGWAWRMICLAPARRPFG